jgi:hypothetical protein
MEPVARHNWKSIKELVQPFMERARQMQRFEQRREVNRIKNYRQNRG